MQIAGVLAGLSGLGGLAEIIGNRFRAGHQPDNLSGGGATVDSTTAATAAETNRDAVSDYDLRRISPRELSRLAGRLFTQGEISAGEYHRLAAIRVELDSSEIRPDEQVDVIQFFSKRIDQLAGNPPDGATTFQANEAGRQLALLKRLAATDFARLGSTVNTLV